MGTLLKFPEKKSIKARQLLSEESNRIWTLLSVVSLVIVAASVNDQMFSVRTPMYVTSERGLETQFRSVASIGGPNGSLAADSEKWESRILDRLGKSRGSELGVPLTDLQKLAVSELGGKYGIELEAGKIKSIKYIPSSSEDSPEDPTNIGRPNDFFIKHSELLFQNKASSSRLESTKDGQQIYEILGLNNQLLGKAKLELDSRGRLKELTLNQ